MEENGWLDGQHSSAMVSTVEGPAFESILGFFCAERMFSRCTVASSHSPKTQIVCHCLNPGDPSRMYRSNPTVILIWISGRAWMHSFSLNLQSYVEGVMPELTSRLWEDDT